MAVELQKKYDLFIDGKWVPSSDGGTLKAYSPSTGEELAAKSSRKSI